ncbi:MAG: hypothetical protein HOE48_10285 [Candidatus Latescibacteria bacterium]|jgi:hypothetical protein|nr:hypothetical protein [Candidatus Latescibacterota bacterium]MBT5828898.1 hypothetical protein [Candidatus Latescibacterota bacterium]
MSTKHTCIRTLAKCGLLLTTLLSPTWAQNVSVTDYSVPVSQSTNLRIDGLSFSYVTEGEDVLVEGGDAGIVYKKFYNSLPYAYSFDFLGSASYNREPSGNRTGTFSSDFRIQVQKYFKDTNKFFYSFSPNVQYRKSFDRPQTDVTVGLGYGRFIDATALRKAVRIEDFLYKEGVLADLLPKETMVELGHIIDKEDEYRDLYDDRSYQNYWYEDMSNEITKTGLVLDKIGAIGLLRMREVLTQETINDRFFGWDVNLGVQMEVLTAEEGDKRKDPGMAFNFRYSRPINWSTQVNTDFQFDTPFNDDFGREYTLTQNIDFIYEITNRIAFTTTNTIRLRKQRLSDAKLSVNSSIDFNFFIENKIVFRISDQFFKAEGASFRQSFNVALSYRIF